MSRETHAREGAEKATGDHILDVALVSPKGSTFARVLGATAGAGLGGNNGASWGVAGALIADRLSSTAHGTDPTTVLAIAEDKLHILGRDATGIVGHGKDLELVATIPRSSLAVERHHRGTTLAIELTDTTTGVTLEFEARPLGNLGVKDLLRELEE
ncbi:hypothetical protein [Curtobacterium sp. RIT-PI-V]|uniref:hypothetical protein n=1 Tax=Curtobacterium sp. RIT-PI-V TaxID=3035296 RepID=UPI0021D8F45D|nr:hypothetical protein [Curtobacterium sp. RIT-PI-V]